MTHPISNFRRERTGADKGEEDERGREEGRQSEGKEDPHFRPILNTQFAHADIKGRCCIYRDRGVVLPGEIGSVGRGDNCETKIELS